MTVYLTAEAAAAGRLSPEELVTVSPSAENAPGATVWLRGGEKMSVSDLLKGVIIGNANDACIALACRISGDEAAFVSEMNAAAFSLGMRNTRFADCTGLSAENISTAHELGLLCRALLQYEWLTPYFTAWRDFLRGEGTELVSENRLTRSYEGLRGMKAGHGEASGYTLAAAAERGQLTAIAVILGCDDPDERFTYAKNLLNEALSQYYVTTPDLSAEFMQPVPVRHGTAAAVLPETGALLSIAAPKGGSISNVVVLPKYLEAPVKCGDIIGNAAFYCGDTLVYESPLTAAEDVPRRGFREAFRMLLNSLYI
jgi:D-alanyl-D-alanine carboxypeptidase (penicillin-binding protein 5/6)